MKRDPVARFDRLASMYETLERWSFGNALTRRRNQYIDAPWLEKARRVLVLGDGDGRFTAAWLAGHPDAHVTAVDASPAMLATLARRVKRRSADASLELCCADARTWEATASGYDAVFTHFFFDCFSTPDVEAIVARIEPILAPDARWIVSEFAIPTGSAKRLAARIVVRALYFAFGALTGLAVRRLPNHARALRGSGFTQTDVKIGVGGLLRSESWARAPLSSPSPRSSGSVTA